MNVPFNLHPTYLVIELVVLVILAYAVIRVFQRLIRKNRH